MARLIGPGVQPSQVPVQTDRDAGEPPPGTRCPQVIIREGTETYRIYERGFDGDPGHVIYQGGITRVARECEFVADNAVTISIGVAGRVITGPSWNDNAIKLPLRAAFVRSGGEAVWSQLYSVEPVMIPGESVVQFVQVEEELYYEVPEGDHINNYIIYVGFDEIANARR